MPYSSEIRVEAVGGSQPSIDVSLILWELYSSLAVGGNALVAHKDLIEQTSARVAGGAKATLSFKSAPGFPGTNHSISLAAYQSDMPGPMFRSGALETLPADALVDVILLDQQRFTTAELGAMIPTPLTLPTDGHRIDTVTVTST
jgi:hypothetical protein